MNHMQQMPVPQKRPEIEIAHDRDEMRKELIRSEDESLKDGECDCDCASCNMPTPNHCGGVFCKAKR